MPIIAMRTGITNVLVIANLHDKNSVVVMFLRRISSALCSLRCLFSIFTNRACSNFASFRASFNFSNSFRSTPTFLCFRYWSSHNWSVVSPREIARFVPANAMPIQKFGSKSFFNSIREPSGNCPLIAAWNRNARLLTQIQWIPRLKYESAQLVPLLPHLYYWLEQQYKHKRITWSQRMANLCA